MHRLIRENLEEVLKYDEVQKGASAEHPAVRHLAACRECREDLTAMRQHAALLKGWRAPSEDVEPRAGFYARVMERIERFLAAKLKLKVNEQNSAMARP